MKERTIKRRAPNATEEILGLIYQIDRLIGALPTNERTTLRTKTSEFRELLLEIMRGKERRKRDRRAAEA